MKYTACRRKHTNTLDDIKIYLKYYSSVWTGLIRFRPGISRVLCEHGNEPLDLMKCVTFLD
jgi:hypothetical protein